MTRHRSWWISIQVTGSGRIRTSTRRASSVVDHMQERQSPPRLFLVCSPPAHHYWQSGFGEASARAARWKRPHWCRRKTSQPVNTWGPRWWLIAWKSTSAFKCLCELLLLEVFITINTLKSACPAVSSSSSFCYLGWDFLVASWVDGCDRRLWSITCIIILSFWAQVVWDLVDGRCPISTKHWNAYPSPTNDYKREHS